MFKATEDKLTPNVSNPFSQLLIEIQEMLRNTTHTDGTATGLTQDFKAVETAYDKARRAQNDLLNVLEMIETAMRHFTGNMAKDTPGIHAQVKEAIAKATGK